MGKKNKPSKQKTKPINDKSASKRLTAKRIYYFILVVSLTVFVGINWCKAIEFTFFSSFNGYNLAFLLWASLLVLPVFDVIDIFGVKLKSPFADPFKEKTDELTAQNSLDSYKLTAQSNLNSHKIQNTTNISINMDDIKNEFSELTGKAVDNDVE